jgi:hypothetical protein
MKDLLILLVHLLTTIAKLLGPGGAKAVVTDSLLMKQQLLVINRTRRRAPNLSAFDRFLFGFGTIRREYLDHILFWNAQDLERKLVDFRQYYNRDRVHQSLGGDAPDEVSGVHQPLHAKLRNYSWISCCNGLMQTPIAA